jgi:hypothetical protein
MQGSTVFSLLIAALIIQTLSCARICSAQISPSAAGGGPKDTLPQQVPSGVDNDPVRSPDDETSLQRNDDGKFTLRRDVEEVILNAHGSRQSWAEDRESTQGELPSYGRRSGADNCRF